MAQVVLASGLGEEAVADWRKKGGAHLHQLLKFLTMRTEVDKKDGRVERSGITALGGPHDPALDGAITHASKCAESLLLTHACVLLLASTKWRCACGASSTEMCMLVQADMRFSRTHGCLATNYEGEPKNACLLS